ncbi:SDR family NAD(P)-dependent oxidoreductase [Streptomyces sp. NPDC096048]|uniref:SDR family NAD(P)-dependent oxidoreductase n=1 Tax=Streptomyces sp. NPDC096048 TaxID=3366072 RepID=UPI0037F19C9F
MITGAAGGIGSEIVNRFLNHGDTVIASDVSQKTLHKWRTRWDSAAPDGRHPSLRTVAADVSSEESLARLAETVQQTHDTVDVLINCAGHFPQTAFEEMSAEEWRRVIDVNLTGTFYTVRSFVPLMKKSSRGRIVSIGSGSVFAGTPNQSHYVAAKGGVLGMTRTLARELGKYNITVNLVTPGLTITPAAAKVLPPALLEMQRNTRALQRDEFPEDVVGPVFFLASDDAAFITGQTLNVDGGRHLL